MGFTKALEIAKQYKLDIIHTQTEFSMVIKFGLLEEQIQSLYISYPVRGLCSTLLLRDVDSSKYGQISCSRFLHDVDEY